MKTRVLIVEDEIIIAEDIREMLEKSGYEVAGLTGEVDEARRLLHATQPDVVLLDITLGQAQLGLELAREIAEKHQLPFIFCTSHGDKSTIKKATQLHPHGYLIKPFDQKDLYSSIEIALANFSSNLKSFDPDDPEVVTSDMIIKDSLFIKEGDLFVKVKIDDITWLSPEGNYTTIYDRQGRKYVVRMPLKDLYNFLPAEKFFRTHRSYMVNMDYVDAINNASVYIGTTKIPLGKNFRDALLTQVRKLQ